MRLFITLAFFVLAYVLPQQSIPYNEIEQAVSTSNANRIVAYGADKILISVNNKEAIYSKQQAAIVLKDFFNKNPISSFKMTIRSQKSSDVSFASGEYQSKDEKFRFSFQFKNIGDSFRIDRIVISEM